MQQTLTLQYKATGLLIFTDQEMQIQGFLLVWVFFCFVLFFCFGFFWVFFNLQNAILLIENYPYF